MSYYPQDFEAVGLSDSEPDESWIPQNSTFIDGDSDSDSDSDALPPVAPVIRRQRSYTVLGQMELSDLQASALEDVTAACNVSDAEAYQLLQSFNWDVNSLVRLYLTNTQAARAKTKLPVGSFLKVPNRRVCRKEKNLVIKGDKLNGSPCRFLVDMVGRENAKPEGKDQMDRLKSIDKHVASYTHRVPCCRYMGRCEMLSAAPQNLSQVVHSYALYHTPKECPYGDKCPFLRGFAEHLGRKQQEKVHPLYKSFAALVGHVRSFSHAWSGKDTSSPAKVPPKHPHLMYCPQSVECPVFLDKKHEHHLLHCVLQSHEPTTDGGEDKPRVNMLPSSQLSVNEAEALFSRTQKALKDIYSDRTLFSYNTGDVNFKDLDLMKRMNVITKLLKKQKGPGAPESKERDRKPQGQVSCELCFGDFDVSQTYGMACGHTFCMGCWRQWVQQKFDDEGSAACFTKCIHYGCQNTVPPIALQRLIGDAKRRVKLAQWLNDAFVGANAFVKWCPNPNCDMAVFYRKPVHGNLKHKESKDAEANAKGDESAGPTGKVVRCQCGTSFCFACDGEDHSPASCAAVRKWQSKASQDSGLFAWVMHYDDQTNIKPCTKCHVMIEKNQGCKHMTCRSCKHEFCWLCFQDWRGHDSSKCTDQKKTWMSMQMKDAHGAELKEYAVRHEVFQFHKAALHFVQTWRDMAEEKVEGYKKREQRALGDSTDTFKRNLNEAITEIVNSRRALMSLQQYVFYVLSYDFTKISHVPEQSAFDAVDGKTTKKKDMYDYSGKNSKGKSHPPKRLLEVLTLQKLGSNNVKQRPLQKMPNGVKQIVLWLMSFRDRLEQHVLNLETYVDELTELVEAPTGSLLVKISTAAPKPSELSRRGHVERKSASSSSSSSGKKGRPKYSSPIKHDVSTDSGLGSGRRSYTKYDRLCDLVDFLAGYRERINEFVRENRL